MKKILLAFLVSLVPTFAFADVSINLDVQSPTGTLYTQTLSVAPCALTTDPATMTTSAKCALEQAALNPQWTNFGSDDWFLTRAGGASQDFANNIFWNWWSNLSYGQTALNKHELQSGESLLVALGVLPLRIDTPSAVMVGATTTVSVEEFGFDAGFNGVWSPATSTTVSANGVAYQTSGLGTFDLVATSTDPLLLTASKTNFVSFTLPLTPTDAIVSVTTPIITSGGAGGDPASGISHPQFNIPNALAYLVGAQHPDGSFDSGFLTDWAALAFAASDSGAAKSNLRNYMLTATPTLSNTTDYERHAMALEALGINPYSGSSADYIAPIVSSFDGTQIGDASLDNDDIFALFPLLHAGYGTGDAIIQKTIAFILSRQEANGAWDDSTDVTAAAIQALVGVNSLPGVSGAVSKAESYLRAQEQTNGGFGNSFTTSWALQAVAALQEPATQFAPAGYTPQDYLATLQQSDGGVEPVSSSAQTRVWATEYAIPATLGKTWNSLLQSFPKTALQVGSGTSASSITVVIASSTLTTVATSTPVATSTVSFEPVSTSTPSVASTTSVAIALATPKSPFQPKRNVQVRLQPKAVEQPASAAIPTKSVVESEQTAAVANAHVGGFFASLWDGLVMFFSSIL